MVTLNHAFECSGMWIMPMKNIINPKSANLKIVNTTIGVKNLVPSQISWLNTGEKFVSFNCMDNKIALKWKSQILILRKTAIKCVLF